ATGSFGGVALSWTANTEGDLAGYNVYRSTSANGTFVKLNTSGLVSGTTFNDTTAPQGVVSYYRVTAVDLNANESTFAAANALRPDSTAPAAPTGANSTNRKTSATVTWTA